MTKVTKDELEELLAILGSHKGRHTELITVYISAGYDPNSVQKQLEAEKATAKNIKSTTTRKNVIDALDKIIRQLKNYRRTPENGLALFAGNVSQVEGQNDLQLWEIEPPLPVKVRLYRCDKEFVLEPLREQLEIKEIYGLLVMDRKEATIGILEGKRIECIQKMSSGIPSKVRAGGQCISPDSLVETKKGTKRIEDIKIGDEIKAFNLTENKITFTKVKKKWKVVKDKYREFIIKDCWNIISSLDHAFFKENNKKIVEVIAEDLSNKDLLIGVYSGHKEYINVTEIREIKDFKEKIKLIDIETEIGNFFANGILVHNSSQRFHRITEGLTKEFYRRIADEMKKIFFDNEKVKGILVGGPIPTKDEFLDDEYLATKLKDKVLGRVDIGDTDESGLKELVEKSRDLLVGQEIVYEKKLLEKFFDTIGAKPDKATYGYENVKKALEYGAVETLIISKKAEKKQTQELKEMAENISAKIEIVSTDTTEGEQFYNLSGIGAFLRFKI